VSKMLPINANNLNSLKNQYSPLNSFYIDENDGTLIFENMKLNIKNIELDEIVLMFDINDFRLFIRNGFYKKSPYYDQVRLLNLSDQFTDDNYKTIDEFVKDIVLRINLYNRYKGILDLESEGIRLFLRDMVDGNKLINAAAQISKPNDKSNATAIVTLFKNYYTLVNTPVDEQQNNQETKTAEKELTRTRNKPDFEKFLQEEQDYIEKSEKMNTAGFTSILAIISVIVAFGVYLAVMAIG